VARTLSEYESKRRLSAHGLPVAPEHLVATAAAAVTAAAALGYPVVAKLCGERIAHKTERGLVRLGLRDAAAVAAAAADLLMAARAEDGAVGVLVAPMVRGTRELIAGALLDPTFGPCVMLGIGGVLAEAVADVAFRLVPATREDAADMLAELRHQRLLDAFRGEPPVDRERLIDVIVGLSALMVAAPEVVAVDVNPLIVCDGVPTVVDALIEIGAR
jgi:acetyl-CoA synthetase (ADP-forming)